MKVKQSDPANPKLELTPEEFGALTRHRRPPKPDIPKNGFSSSQQAEAWGQLNYANVAWDLKGTKAQHLAPALRQFDKLAKEYPEVAERLQYFGTYRDRDKLVKAIGHDFMHEFYDKPGAVPAFAHVTPSGDQFGFSPIWFGSKSAAEVHKTLKECERSGHLAKGCDSIESIVTHEFGHLVQNWFQSKLFDDETYDPYLFNLYNQFIQTHVDTPKPSRYAETNLREAWAEAFASDRFTPVKDQILYTKAQAGFLKYFVHRFRQHYYANDRIKIDFT